MSAVKPKAVQAAEVTRDLARCEPVAAESYVARLRRTAETAWYAAVDDWSRRYAHARLFEYLAARRILGRLLEAW